MMRILIRADASTVIGSGHVMRCLTIANNFRRLGHQVVFWMSELPGHLIDLVISKGFSVTQTVMKADLLIVDHYQFGVEWETEMRAWAKKIIVIDDLANRRHDCDLLLDQNVVPNYEHRYDALVPAQCRKLLGPTYLIMRDEFVAARGKSRNRSGKVERLLVFMGGSDPTDETTKVLQALQHTNTSFKHVDVVVGNSCVKRDDIKRLCEDMQLHYYCQIDYMAELMRLADFSIGAGGSSMWERCYVGLPSASTVVAENQRLSTNTAEELNAIIQIGWHVDVSSTHYLQLLDKLPAMSEQLMAMSEQGYKITESQDGPNAWLQEMVGLLS
ncbi:UDP-2,4-diacetamido-2,4,6-trideoxy-beta-L-altropyranose hydrolase [Paenibacillus septentrionalis]|uniref:UDP-2,4-diacetamido-2,4, 6-trideoxy-beta-L-altropyranose hydrolase n=1 Tax=Paenibacillus septentrionalis TaxID=429342 RepID=A0ABW1V9E4_9BACL